MVTPSLLYDCLYVTANSCFVIYFSPDSPVLKYKDALSTTLFSFLLDVNSSLCCATVDCLMVLVDLTGLLTEKEASLMLEILCQS